MTGRVDVAGISGGITGIVFRSRERRVEKRDLFSIAFPGCSGGMEFPSAMFGNAGLAAGTCRDGSTRIAEQTVSSHPVAMVFHGAAGLEGARSVSTERDSVSKLLGLYLKEGVDFIQRLRGQFALAVWDARDETLYLATDRFRTHPIFYYSDPDVFIFASRIRGICSATMPIRLTIDPQAIVQVIGSSIIPTPLTIFQEIRKVPAGHVLRCRAGSVDPVRYWGVSFSNPSRESEDALAKRLKASFRESLTHFLHIDEGVDTVGAYLSGGVDSSTVTGVLTEVLGKPVDTFSIGFGVENFNEINYARLASNAFRSRHHEYFVTPEDTFRAIPLLAGMFDEPYANASAIPAYYCAKMAKENSIDILYAGDGGDELFAGNERYSFMRLFEYYSGLPPWLREAVVKPLVFGAGDLLNLEILDKGKKYIRRASLPYYRRITSYDIFSTVPLSEFLEGDFLAAVGKDYDPFSQYRRYYFEAPADCELDRHLYLDWYLTLSDNDLIKVTRTAEAAGVDVRFPFLDHKLVEFSVSVPARMKMRGTRLRTFFKRAYADLLPPEIRKKKKHGFGLPIPVWLKTDKRLNGLMRDLVLGPQAAQRGYFRKKSIENLVEEHKRDTTSYYGTILWNLMAMELWFRYSASPPIRQ